jgi:WD40-like Beta Propeller Repeat
MSTLACATLALALLAMARSSARADFTPASLVSDSPTLQADYAYSPAISADGKYVAFVGSVASIKGVYVKDLSDNKQLELVALGNASAPSISEDGRYVSFTTSDDPLTGAPTADECSQVYVRDMTVAMNGGSASPFMLASARNGTDEPLAYAGTGKPGCPGHGSAAADRVALSVEGEKVKVAFTVIGRSDLTEGQPGTPETPPDQIAVRDLTTKTTTLVSATLASQQSGVPQAIPLGGAIAGNGGAIAGNETPLQEDPSDNPISASTAAISADGSTVAWMGIDIPEQAPVGPPGPGGEDKYGYVGASEVEYYAEPLWRRIADGPTAPTRRILGEDAPSDPGFAGPLNLSWDPLDLQSLKLVSIYGSYIVPAGFERTGRYQDAAKEPSFSSITPQLSANGYKVALLSTAPTDGAEPIYPRSAPSTVPSNVFLVNMTPGLSRAEAIRPITAWGATDFGSDLAATAPIGDLTISSDGTRLAFTTIRTLFPLAPPELVTPQVTTTSFPQLYEADMRSDTLALVSEGYDGEPAAGSVYTPSFDGGGNTLTFASSAPNLVYGASNPGHSDVFAVSAIVPPLAVGPQSVTPLPLAALPAPSWRLSATVRHGPHDSLLLDVVVPGAGSLSAIASAATNLAATAPGGQAGHRGGSKARNLGGRARGSSTMPRIASARRATAQAGLVELRLNLFDNRLKALARRRGGLYAKIAIGFLAAGRPRLRETLQASFEEVKARVHSIGKPAAKRTGRSTPHRRK